MLRPMAGVLGEISALRSSAGEAREPTAAKRIAARFAGESGQATIEFAGILPLMLIVLIAMWQIVLVGLTFVFAGHAARVGARALAVGNAAQPAAVNGLPSAWRSGSQVISSTDQNGHGEVDVHVKIPVLFPGAINLPVSGITSHSGTVVEDQVLPGEQGWSMLTPAGADTPAIFGPALLTSPFLRYAPGNVPVLDPQTGFLEAPHGAPVQVLEMIAAANEIRDFPYPHPVAHWDGQNLTDLWPSYDCSGATSFVLHAANFIGDATDSTGLESWGVPGSSQWVTVYANGEHAHIVIDGFNFDTAAGEGMPPNPPPDGPRWTTDTTDAGVFQARTWPGL